MAYENVINEPVKDYKPNSKERISLLEEYDRQSNEKIEIPIIIGGEKIYTNITGTCIAPHNHNQILATYHKANNETVNKQLKIHLKLGKVGQILPLRKEHQFFEKQEIF